MFIWLAYSENKTLNQIQIEIVESVTYVEKKPMLIEVWTLQLVAVPDAREKITNILCDEKFALRVRAHIYATG